jgi:hypothetical protein
MVGYSSFFFGILMSPQFSKLNLVLTEKEIEMIDDESHRASMLFNLSSSLIITFGIFQNIKFIKD